MIGQIKCLISGIGCIYLLILKIPISHSSSNVTTLEQNEVEIDSCEDWQFQCKNKQCIAKPFICDGYADCEDSSDETTELCRLTKCDKQRFQCKYGACIEKKYRCDDKIQCIDESDELACVKTVYSVSGPSWCPIPMSTIDKAVDFVCNGDPSKACTLSNGTLPKFTVATITCATNYYRENKDNTSAHTCSYFYAWSPPITKCLKKCNKLKPTNVNLKCYRDRVSLDDCDGNSVGLLLAGTKVRPMCKSAYKYDSPPSYFEITCNEDGEWDNTLLPCVPECGKPYTPAKTTVFGGAPEKNGGSPWHAAIFNKNKELICGGTIISENLVLSAAHCFSSEGNSCEGTACAEDFEVVVGKYTSNYSAKDNVYQRTMKIIEIHFPEEGYHGLINYHASDLAILVLSESIPISPAVLPACINWEDLVKRKYPLDGELGKIVGWGRTENDTLSTILRTIHLPFISYKRCIDVVDNDFKAFVTLDKICAGTGNRTGPTLLDGDSGGGLLFEDRGLFYLRGVVSIKQDSSNAATLFTDLANYVEWIVSVHDKFKSKSHPNQMKLSSSRHPETIPQYATLSANEKKSNSVEKINQEDAKQPLLDEILNHLKNFRFFAAEQRLSQMDPNIYYNFLHEIYNNHTDNFDLLLNYGNFIGNMEHKFKIYEFLYNETVSSGLNDALKLFRFSQSVKNGILDQSTGFLPAEVLYKKLFNASIKAAIKLISSAYQNDVSWSVVQKLENEIFYKCRKCSIIIYGSMVEALWNKTTLYEMLDISGNFQNIETAIVTQIAITKKLKHTAALNTTLAKAILRYMKEEMAFPNYKNVRWDIKIQFEELVDNLLSYVNSTIQSENEANRTKNVKTNTGKEVNRELLSEIMNDILSHQFFTAEQKLSEIDPSAYLNISHLVWTNAQAKNFDLLLDFGDSVHDMENKLKIYEFLYNNITPSGHDYPQKLLRLSLSLKKETLDQSATVAEQVQELHQSLKNAIIRASISPITSAFQNDISWSAANKLSRNISRSCFDCTIMIYNSVVKAVWNEITFDDLLRKADENLAITEVIAVHVAVTDELERTGALYTTSAVTLARNMKATMQAYDYKEVDSHKRSHHNDAKNKLPLSVKNLVFSSTICIKNSWFHEYLYADITANDVYKSDKHHVYTRIPRDKEELQKFKWYVSFWSSHQIQLRDDRFSEYLYAGSKMFNDSRRYVLTWNTYTPNINVAWDVEVDGSYIRIKDNVYQEFLFADYDKQENQTKRHVFTYHREGRALDDKWQIDDCS